MEKIMTQLKLLMKDVMGAPKKVVNVVSFTAYEYKEAKNIDEEIQ